MKYKLKDIGIIILLLFLTNSAFGQQFLWSTLNTDSGIAKKFVPLNNVTKEVLTFYDQYHYYFDLSGYSKKRFIEEINYGFDDWNWINDINELTVYALRSNSGRGSVVMVLCVTKDNVNLILFSNDIMTHENPQSGMYYKDKFVGWFKTLLN